MSVHQPWIAGTGSCRNVAGRQPGELRNGRVVVDHVGDVRDDRRLRQIGVVDPIADEPASVLAVHDLTCGLPTVEHGALNRRPEVGREDAIPEWKWKMLDHVRAVRPPPRLPLISVSEQSDRTASVRRGRRAALIRTATIGGGRRRPRGGFATVDRAP